MNGEVQPDIAAGWSLLAQCRTGQVIKRSRAEWDLLVAAEALLTVLGGDHADEILAAVVDGRTGYIEPARIREPGEQILRRPRPGRSPHEQPRLRLARGVT